MDHTMQDSLHILPELSSGITQLRAELSNVPSLWSNQDIESLEEAIMKLAHNVTTNTNVSLNHLNNSMFILQDHINLLGTILSKFSIRRATQC